MLFVILAILCLNIYFSYIKYNKFTKSSIVLLVFYCALIISIYYYKNGGI